MASAFRKIDALTATIEEKKALVAEYKNSGLPQAEFCHNHGVSPRTFQDWVTDYNKTLKYGIEFFHENKGRPKKIDSNHMQKVVELHKDLSSKENTPNKQESEGLIMQKWISRVLSMESGNTTQK